MSVQQVPGQPVTAHHKISKCICLKCWTPKPGKKKLVKFPRTLEPAVVSSRLFKDLRLRLGAFILAGTLYVSS
jgi:hypothetical protein